MSPKSFVFSSPNLPKAKARQLHKAFPFLSLSTAQEMTARALGYPSWFECAKRGTSGPPSLGDQEAGLDTRVVRYYQQANVLINYGVTPHDADRWVRAWGLTGRPTLALKHAAPLFYEWDSALNAFERGDIDEETFLDEHGDHPDAYGDNKYHIDRPARLTSSVIVGPMSRYPIFAVHPALSAQIPIYMRGPIGMYHYEDDVDLLALYAPDFPYPEDDDYHERFNWVHHEWHYGRQHPLAHFPMLPHLIAQARSNPDELFVLTNRAMPLTGEGEAYDFDRRAVACLLGNDFAEFLLNKGVVNSSAVIWFNDVAIDDTPTTYGFSNRFDKAQKLPIFSASRKYQTSLPIYSYPFMRAPMADAEYQRLEEIECVLPLREDYSHDEGGGTNRPGQPAGPVRPYTRIWSRI